MTTSVSCWACLWGTAEAPAARAITARATIFWRIGGKKKGEEKEKKKEEKKEMLVKRSWNLIKKIKEKKFGRSQLSPLFLKNYFSSVIPI